MPWLTFSEAQTVTSASRLLYAAAAAARGARGGAAKR